MPERMLVFDPDTVGVVAATVHANALGCPMLVRGLAPWMRDAGIRLGADGYAAVLVCLVPEHNARHEVLAVLRDAQLTATAVAAVVDHVAPATPPDMATRVRSVDTSTITDAPTRTVFDRLKDALTG